ALAVAGQQQPVHAGVEVGALHGALQLDQQLACQPVAALGAVQRDTRDPPGDLVLNDAHTGSARSMIAPASTVRGNVPYTRPPSPASRVAQKASATAGGENRTNSDACSATARSSTIRRASNCGSSSPGSAITWSRRRSR